MSPVRIAVVGAGLIGRKHIEALTSGAEDYVLAAVADPAPAAAEAGRKHGYDVYGSVEEMLAAARPDGVVIATPNRLHVSTGLACVAAGLPILIEKPLADTVGEALRLIEAAEAAGVATLTGHHRRHNPIMAKAAALIRDGAIGRPVAATALWLSHKPEGYHDLAWRREPGGGPVLINAIHDIDCLRMLLGDIETVQATTSSAARGFAVEDTAAAIFTFNSGALGTLILSDAAVSPWSWETTSGENPAFPKTDEDAIMIAGSEGSLAVPSLRLRRQEAGRQSWIEPLSDERAEIVRADPYYPQLANFAAVIRGEAAPVVSGREGVATLATTLAITRSAETGAPARVADLLAG